jgi:beta-N-acetylhexosaminidase
MPATRRSLLAAAGLAAAGPALLLSRSRPARAASSQVLAGQRVIHAYSGLTPPDSLLTTISSGGTAGVLFFGDNIESESQITSVINQLRDAAASSPIDAPLLLMTDQEGGEVRRLPGAPDESEKEIGESTDPTGEATDAGTGAGQNLSGVGMNLNLAPVLDVYRSAGDFDDQYERSYSMDSATCESCGAAFVTAQQKTGVAATAKHFPGLGAATASQNTDNEPVTLNVSASKLRSIDEAAYPASISAGVKLVMCSWAIYPSLDASNPAGLSSTIVSNELRSRLGFKGVTITDSIGAGALSPFGSIGNRSVLAAAAGMDLILATTQDAGDEAVSALAAALDDGTLNSSTFTTAANRVTALRSSLT